MIKAAIIRCKANTYLFNAFEELDECGCKKNAILLNLGDSFCGNNSNINTGKLRKLNILLDQETGQKNPIMMNYVEFFAASLSNSRFIKPFLRLFGFS